MSAEDDVPAMSSPESTLTVTDNRTGRSYEIPIEEGTIRASALRQITTGEGDPGLMSFDPAFTATASCHSAITFIDGDAGILRYRGYPIDQLAEFTDTIVHHTFVHENIKKFVGGFHHDAHPMGILVGTVGALSTFYPEAKNFTDPVNRRLQMARLIAKMPTLAAYAFRHSRGLPYVYPDNELSYPGNFLSMMWKMSGRYEPEPVLEHALDVLFILHADHEQNCSTNAMRAVGSSRVDPYSAAAAAVAALYGPLHGGANEQVLRMLREIGTVDAVPAYVGRVKKGDFRLMGFGHRVYKNYDPRAKVVRQIAEDVFGVTGLNPLLEVAIELERIALADDYFIGKKLYPNVDFYTGIIYEAMGFPVEMFTGLFAIGRMPGWLSQWEEGLLDPEQKIARPRQIYTGQDERPYVDMADRRHTDHDLVEPPPKPIGGD